ncbi:MAG: hypothetical protein H7333_06255 [Bdellovibrionales bacterium]|nr:hypothetical protein [Oligoflexia bacterium]
MRCQKQIWFRSLAFTLLMLGSFPCWAQSVDRFRTPAKLYGAGYSIKMTIRREGFEYDIPMWVKPDQKESSLDRAQLFELGWVYPNLKVEEAALSGQVLSPPHFKNIKSEWAYVPEFPRSCCYGIIGQDILKDYEVRFDPNPPAHLEWTRVSETDHVKPISSSKLSPLFSIRGVAATMGKQKIDLSRTPYRLKFSTSELTFEDSIPVPIYALKGPLFHYHFAPPARMVIVDSLSSSLISKAKKVGFKSGLLLTRLNHLPVGGMSRFEVDEYLMGKREKVIELTWNKGTTAYDFEKNEFTSAQSIQTPARRH